MFVSRVSRGRGTEPSHHETESYAVRWKQVSVAVSSVYLSVLCGVYEVSLTCRRPQSGGDGGDRGAVCADRGSGRLPHGAGHPRPHHQRTGDRQVPRRVQPVLPRLLRQLLPHALGAAVPRVSNANVSLPHGMIGLKSSYLTLGELLVNT